MHCLPTVQEWVFADLRFHKTYWQALGCGPLLQQVLDEVGRSAAAYLHACVICMKQLADPLVRMHACCRLRALAAAFNGMQALTQMGCLLQLCMVPLKGCARTSAAVPG